MEEPKWRNVKTENPMSVTFDFKEIIIALPRFLSPYVHLPNEKLFHYQTKKPTFAVSKTCITWYIIVGNYMYLIILLIISTSSMQNNEHIFGICFK